MDNKDLERWNKLSAAAKQVGAAILQHTQHANTSHVSLNDLRQTGLDSRTIIAALHELELRAFGKLTDETDANPSFIAIVPVFQSIVQTHRKCSSHG